jgi:hypothetical protein
VSVYQVTVKVEASEDSVVVPAHEGQPAVVTLLLDADTICYLLAQAFEQELSVRYVEDFLAEWKVERSRIAIE